MLFEIIQDMGHSVACCFTLGSGMSKVLTGNFDLVLLDVGLPDGNGLDAIPQIQKIEAAPQVIIITASGDQNGAELGLETGRGTTSKNRLQSTI